MEPNSLLSWFSRHGPAKFLLPLLPSVLVICEAIPQNPRTPRGFYGAAAPPRYVYLRLLIDYVIELILAVQIFQRFVSFSGQFRLAIVPVGGLLIHVRGAQQPLFFERRRLQL
jgi:hypothetical protein